MTWPVSPTSYARGSIVNPSTGDVIDLGFITKERQSLEFGIWAQPVAGMGSYAQALASPLGKVREIILEGHFNGTMVEMERDFLKPLEDWMNVGDNFLASSTVEGFTLPDARWYFPHLHPQREIYKYSTGDSSSYVSTWSSDDPPTQRYKFAVLMDALSWEYSDDYPNRIDWMIVLIEGSIID